MNTDPAKQLCPSCDRNQSEAESSEEAQAIAASSCGGCSKQLVVLGEIAEEKRRVIELAFKAMFQGL